jgi:hypothetical protein
MVIGQWVELDERGKWDWTLLVAARVRPAPIRPSWISIAEGLLAPTVNHLSERADSKRLTFFSGSACSNNTKLDINC